MGNPAENPWGTSSRPTPIASAGVSAQPRNHLRDRAGHLPARSARLRGLRFALGMTSTCRCFGITAPGQGGPG
jgi:hypothetical protein